MRRTTTARDGRTIEFELSGPDDGRVLLFHHGTPGSAAAPRAVERAAHERGLRLLVPARPGYGGSARNAGRTVASVVEDADAVLDAIGADACLVAGWSGGGPHALACAAGLSRATGTLVMAGVAPFGADGLDFLAGMGSDNVQEFGAGVLGEDVLRAHLDALRPGLAAARGVDVAEEMASLLPPVDVAAMTGEFADDLAASMRDGLRAGVDGWLDDDLAFLSDWGFDLADVRGPVALWQGSEDLMVPFAHGRWLAARLPAARAHLLEGDGHVSVVAGRIAEMLDELVAAA